jgi:putative phosphoesterase
MPQWCEQEKQNEGTAMTLVGVLSDTHGTLPLRAYEALADCDYIIHAGDIGDRSILTELGTLAPVAAVLGNNDFPEYGKDVSRFARPVIDGVRFLVAHYPRDVRISMFGNSAVAPGDPIPDICVHGHTHVPEIKFGAEVRPVKFVVCPGSVSRPRGGSVPSVAKIDIDNGHILQVRIETLDGKPTLSVGRGRAAE